ncbi:MAG: hypothetical protein P8X47_11120 [Ignavibacteriaceae bacterium]
MFAIIVALTLTALFYFIIRRSGLLGNVFLFFLIVFLGAWAGGLWLRPIGPPINGFYWINYLITGFLLALLLAAIGSPDSSSERKKVEFEAEENKVIEKRTREPKRFDLLLTSLVLLLIIVILLGYTII